MEYNLGNVFKSVMKVASELSNLKQYSLYAAVDRCVHSDTHTFLIRKVLTRID